MIQQIEERTLNAWPGVRQLLFDGWVLRFSDGITRRANSVNALFPGSGHVEDKITWCEEQYRAQQLPTIFKITPLTQPDTLDGLLAARGYQLQAETDVLYAPIAAMHLMPNGISDSEILPREEWLDVYAQLLRLSPGVHLGHQAIIRATVPMICPVAVWNQENPVAVGLGVLERGMVGINDLVTDAQYRRQGNATRILTTILSWAVNHGAQGAYLNVMSENQPAQALYAKLGFLKCYKYWYRIKNTVTDI